MRLISLSCTTLSVRSACCISAMTWGAAEVTVPLPHEGGGSCAEQNLSTCHQVFSVTGEGALPSTWSSRSPAFWNRCPSWPVRHCRRADTHSRPRACEDCSSAARRRAQACILVSANAVAAEELRAQGVPACRFSRSTARLSKASFQLSPAESTCFQLCLPSSSGTPAASPIAKPSRLWACLRCAGGSCPRSSARVIVGGSASRISLYCSRSNCNSRSASGPASATSGNACEGGGIPGLAAVRQLATAGGTQNTETSNA
mmetsp:Transcript_83646/g.223708  ORF Transcript_83646/g.223708 Transcript_83646/m.223708 type:complete len:259 (-) Transcript_83646:1-777(-)